MSAPTRRTELHLQPRALLDAMAAKNYTQHQLADEAGVNPITVNRAIAGKPVRYSSAWAMADALDVGLLTLEAATPN